MEVDTAVGEALLLLLGRDARAAYAADHELGEGEVLELLLRTVQSSSGVRKLIREWQRGRVFYPNQTLNMTRATTP